MRKTLILFLIIILLAVMGYMLFESFSLGGLQILGVRGLSEENAKLDQSIQKASKLSSTDYQEALKNLTGSAKDYKAAKAEYDELVTISTSSEVAVASQLQKYEIEYLWTKIGTHATSEDVVLRLEVNANSTSAATGYYDLDFTVAGDYVGITDFIYDIENDSSLGFKIEEFKMIPVGAQDNGQPGGASGGTLNATFTCKNIAINIDPSEIAGQKTEENSDEESGEENTADSTGNTSNTNTINNTNTTRTNTTRQ